MTCSSFTNVLDFECIFVNTFAGSWTIFAALALFVIMLICAKFGLQTSIVGMAVLLFGVLMYQWIPWILPLALIVAVFLIGVLIINAIKR